MNMKYGYKQTEIGLIPEDWEEKILGEIGQIRMCKRIFAYETSIEGEIPFYKIGTFGKAPDAFITKNLFNEYKSKYPFPKTGDILISASGTIGRTVVYDGKAAYFQDSNIIWIEIDEKHIINKYLFYLYKIMKWNTEGGTIQRLYNDILNKVKVVLPSIKEQTAIAEALSDIDSLITEQEKIIAKKKVIKQGAMQELLRGKKRLPGFSGEWRKVKLADLCLLITDGSHESPTEIKNGYYMPSVKDMSYNNFSYSDCKMISQNDYERLVRNGCKPQINDIVIAKDGSMLKYVFTIKEEVSIVILSSIAILRPNQTEVNSEYLVHYFRQPSFVDYVILNNKTGTGVPRIVLKNFKGIQIMTPELEEQTAIATALTDMDIEIEQLENKLSKYQRIKEGMMTDLLTGRVRLI